MEKMVKILLLEDNIYDAELVRHQIAKDTTNYQFKHVSTFDEFSRTIDEYVPDIILSDYNLVGFTGMDALELVNKKCNRTPFIIVTGTIDEETAAETIKKGAWDYIVKERLIRLNSAMKNALKLKAEKEESARAREELKISEERYKLAIEGSQDGIWDWDLKSDTMYLSSRWKSMLGYKENEIENNLKGWNRLIHPADKEFAFTAFQRHLIKATPYYHGEFRLKCKDGTYKWISARYKAIFDKNDKPYRIAGSHTDISERKFMEGELIKAKDKAEESDRLKSAFLANMSHEIRTPMNGILGFSELLKTPNLSGEEQQEYISIIEKSGTRMLNIINDIVSISKIEAGMTEVTIGESDINEQLDYIYTFFKPEVEGKGMRLILKNPLPLETCLVDTDKEKIFAVLTNLVKNAIKYSEKGTIELGYTLEGEYLKFYVADSGIGIDAHRQEAIFERFIQADVSDKKALQGAGLGLAISKAYVEMLGGKLWVTSEKNIGSTFFFTIPYITEDKKTMAMSEGDSDHTLQVRNLKILIVEDDEMSDLLMTITLEEISRETLHAKNGLDAIKICHTNPDIDLILMDIKMPGISGYEATREIRQFNKKVPIIAQTAFGLLGDKEKAIEAGCNAYIKKPITTEKLFALIQTLF